MEEIAIRTAQPLETLMSNSWRPSGFPNKNPRRPVTTVRAGPEGQHPIPDRSQSAHSQVATVDTPTSLPQCAELGPGHQPCHTCHCHSVAEAAAHTRKPSCRARTSTSLGSLRLPHVCMPAATRVQTSILPAGLSHLSTGGLVPGRLRHGVTWGRTSHGTHARTQLR